MSEAGSGCSDSDWDKVEDLDEVNKPNCDGSTEQPGDSATKPWEPGYGKIAAEAGEHIPKPIVVDVNIPEAYERHCHRTFGRSDAEFVREQYEKDYPIINPNGETEHARRGMPDGHDDKGNPTYHNGIPPRVKLEMMHAPLAPTRAKASYTYSYTQGHEPWKQKEEEKEHAGQAGLANSEAAEHKEPSKGDSNGVPVTGGVGYGLASWPPKHKPNPYEYRYTKGDEWQQAGDTCAAKRRCGGASASSDNQNSSSDRPGPSSTQSQINSKFNY